MSLNERTLLLVLLSLLATTSRSFAQSFTANVEVRRPNTSGAIVQGSISYDYPGRRYRLDYPNRLFHEIFNFGLPTSTPPNAATGPWHYEAGINCVAGCRATPIDAHLFPVYVNDPSIYQPSSGPVVNGCDHYSPIAPASTAITDIWFDPTTGNICRALWADGAAYTFSSVVAVNLTSSVIFLDPDLCVGGDRTDLLILLDRSASIQQATYDAARAFIKSFVQGVTLSPSQVHVGLAQFDVGVQLVEDLFEGTSLPNVDAGVNSMSCACQDTLNRKLKPAEVGVGAPTCCARRTSISAALDWASAFLTSNGRGDATPTLLTRKVVVVITDGYANTLRDGVTPCSGATCKADLQAAFNALRQAHDDLEIYGVSTHPVGGDGLAFTVLPPITQFVPGPIGCSAGSTCDPTSCGGLCECNECTAPSACDPSTDYCQVNQVVPGGRKCELLPRDCTQVLGATLCDNAYCDVAAQACKTRTTDSGVLGAPICANIPINQPLCYSHRCVENTGVCTTDVFADPSCTNECNQDSDCNDNNACTVDTCAVSTLRFCQFTPKSCGGPDPCTEYFCTDPVAGCQSRPQPSTFCDDNNPCTADTCVPFQGCVHTPISCNDGQSCTTDSCDPNVGCVNSICPAGTTPVLGACWALGGWGANAGAPLDCNQVCAGVGLTYDNATQTIVGSAGTDGNCEAVLTALGTSAPFAAPSASCAAGLGCFSDVMFFPNADDPTGDGRCATPATAATATKPWVRRACACK
jgi:hypothetical protein